MFKRKSPDLTTRIFDSVKSTSSTQRTVAGALTGVAALAVGAYAFLRDPNVKSKQAKNQTRNPDGTFKPTS